MADLYRVSVTEQRGGLRLEWTQVEGRQTWQRAREGAYLLRTNLPAVDPQMLWKSYIQLTEAEAAFRQRADGPERRGRANLARHRDERWG